MLLSNPWRHKCDPLEDEIRWAPHYRILANLHPQRVKENDRVHRLQGAALPSRDLAHDGVGDAADEVGRDVYRVHRGEKTLDLAHRHSVGIHGDNLVVKAGKATLVLANELRLERGRDIFP